MLLPTAPAATHGRSLVVHKSNKWAKSLVAALTQLPSSSGRTQCGLCRFSARPLFRCSLSHVSCLPHSWNSGCSFFSDAVMQDSWWRLIVYFDVVGMVATRGVPFDSFFASEHAVAFASVIQVCTFNHQSSIIIAIMFKTNCGCRNFLSSSSSSMMHGVLDVARYPNVLRSTSISWSHHFVTSTTPTQSSDMSTFQIITRYYLTHAPCSIILSQLPMRLASYTHS